MSTQADRDALLDWAILAGLITCAERSWAERMILLFESVDENGCEIFRARLADNKQRQIEKAIRVMCDRGQPGR